jgi:hypothetical protein
VNPPTGVTACQPTVVAATPTEYVLQNPLKSQNFVWGELVGAGELTFVVENLPKDGTGCPGWWLFEQVIRHFGAAVRAIQGNWTYGDNLAAVNALTAAGQTVRQAALQTKTGQYASGYNFTVVQLIQAVGVPGAFTEIRVLFTAS